MKKSRENILITRTLSENSPIWQLSKNGHHIIDQSFVSIQPVAITDIPKYEIYFYYSKNGAKHFLNAAKYLGIDLSNAKHAALGNGTAAMIESYGMKVDFIGQGTPPEIANAFIHSYADLSICFVRAEQSTQSIQKHWPKEYSEVISYTIAPAAIDLEEEIHTIFATSPMNLTTAMDCCNVNTLQRIICIGPTTYNTASQYKSVAIITADQSSEQSMLDCYLNQKEH